jgi:ribonuclease HI
LDAWAHEEGHLIDTEAWTIFYDGTWGTFSAGAAAILISPSKMKTYYAARLEFNCTNIIAEYEAVNLGFESLGQWE